MDDNALFLCVGALTLLISLGFVAPILDNRAPLLRRTSHPFPQIAAALVVGYAVGAGLVGPTDLLVALAISIATDRNSPAPPEAPGASGAGEPRHEA